MRHLYIVGIGAGHPEHITVQAINTLNEADVLFVATKGETKTELADVRRDICERYVTNDNSRIVEYAVPVREIAAKSYEQSVDDWHAAIAERYERLIADELAEGQKGAFLVWGDPSLYDSTIRIVERVKVKATVPFEFSVIPGITSIQALAASHKIPINMVGKSLGITSGRRLAEIFPGEVQTAIVMLDGQQAFSHIDDPETFIFWGAYLGTKDEMIISGRVTDVAEQILATRAAARERLGWIMDIYLLRKGADFDA